MFFTLLICCFLGLGALQPSCAAPRTNENKIVQVELKQRDNLYANFGYMSISYYECFSRMELYSQFSSSFTQASLYGTQYSMPYLTTDTWFIKTTELDVNNPERSVTNYGVPLTHAYYFLSASGFSGTIRYQFWNLYLYFGSYEPLIFEVEVMYDNSTTGGQMIGVDILRLLSNESNLQIASLIICRSSSYLYHMYVDNVDEYLWDMAYEAGYTESKDEIYTTAYNEGDANGYDRGYNVGYSAGETAGYNAGEQNGYAQGLSDGQANSGVAQTIFAGCVEVGLLPVNVFLKMFEYEVFGINIAGFVSALMTIAIVIIIIRMVTGGKNDK